MYGILTEKILTDYIESDTIKGRICNNCYKYFPWDHFKNDKGKYENYIGNSHENVCKNCTDKNYKLDSNEPVDYIFYMHPDSSTNFYSSMEKYWLKAKAICKTGIKNDAMKYPFHITLTSFFQISDEKTLNSLISSIENKINSLSGKNLVSDTETYYVPSKSYISHYTKNIAYNFSQNFNLNEKEKLFFKGISLNSPEVINMINNLQKDFNFIKAKPDLHMTLYHNVNFWGRQMFENEIISENMNSNTCDKWKFILWKSNKNHTIWEKVKEF